MTDDPTVDATGARIRDLVGRLLMAAYDEWDISAESATLARDALAEIERLRGVLDAFRERMAEAEAEACRRTDDLVAIGEALERPGATAAECVAIVRRMRSPADAGDLAGLAARGGA